MSDFGRKDFSDKISEKVTPDSQKSYLDKAKETTTNAYDNVANKLQPDENKSVSQTAADVAHGAKGDIFDAGSKASSDAQANTESYVEQAKKLAAEAQEKGQEYLNAGSETAKSAIHSAGEYINNASEYFQGKQ